MDADVAAQLEWRAELVTGNTSGGGRQQQAAVPTGGGARGQAPGQAPAVPAASSDLLLANNNHGSSRDELLGGVLEQYREQYIQQLLQDVEEAKVTGSPRAKEKVGLQIVYSCYV